MRREQKSQVKVKIGLEVMWRALTKDFKSVCPSSMPQLVKDLEILEGDGGFGTLYLFTFGPGVPNMSYQKEKVADFDESQHMISLEVIEGGRLLVGFTYHKATFQLTAIGDSETMVDLKVEFETENEEANAPGGMIKSVVASTQAMETFLLKQ